MKRALTVITALLCALMLCPESIADGTAEAHAPIAWSSPEPGTTAPPYAELAPVEAETPQPNPLFGNIGQEPEPSPRACMDTPPDGTEPTPAPENPQPSEPGAPPGPPPAAPEPTPASVAVPVTVTVNAPTFTIVLPAAIDFGMLNPSDILVCPQPLYQPVS